jgi:Tfp pilus assembly protein PilF
MRDRAIFYTASMAGLCAAQGYFDKSAEIYRHLLESDPENDILRQSLAEVETKQTAVTGASRAAAAGLERLEPMIRKWVELMVEHDLKSRFDKIRRNVKQIQFSDISDR